MTLPKKSRISSSREIKNIYKTGKTVRGTLVFIKFSKNNTNKTKIAIIVPKSVSKTAVTRNKLKRKISNSLTLVEIPSGINLVVTAIPTILEKSNQEIKSDVEKITKKIFVNKY